MLERKRAPRISVNGTTTITTQSILPNLILGIRTQVVDFIDFNAGGLGLSTDKPYPRFLFVYGKAQLQNGNPKHHFKWKGAVVWSEYDKKKQKYHTGICLMRRQPKHFRLHVVSQGAARPRGQQAQSNINNQ